MGRNKDKTFTPAEKVEEFSAKRTFKSINVSVLSALDVSPEVLFEILVVVAQTRKALYRKDENKLHV